MDPLRDKTDPEAIRLDARSCDPQGYRRTTLMRRTLQCVIALIVAGAAFASIPYWESPDFPLMSLLVYVIGMGFVTMPLCMYYEWLCQAHARRVEQVRDAAYQAGAPRAA